MVIVFLIATWATIFGFVVLCFVGYALFKGVGQGVKDAKNHWQSRWKYKL